MKTITFYSYKGGVGRSLALSNMAIKLSQLGKKVCLIDFDIEAPGLQYKFSNDYKYEPVAGNKGLVDHIYKFSNEGVLNDSIQCIVGHLVPKNRNYAVIDIISAGDFENDDDYWKKLSVMKWSEMFYSAKPKGTQFFLDLKAKIQKEIKPDYLLIDSRTGITDIAGITLKLLADKVVILAVNNEENKFGTKKVVNALLKADNHEAKIHFVLTRLPYPDSPLEKAEESDLVKKWRDQFNLGLNSAFITFSSIYSDRGLQKDESLKINITKGSERITLDYQKLFSTIFDETLNVENEDSTIKIIKEADELYEKSLTEEDKSKKLKLLTDAIEIYDKKPEYYFERGLIYLNIDDFKSALKDFEKSYEQQPDDDFTKYYLAIVNGKLERYDKALEYLNDPFRFPQFYHIKSTILILNKQYDEALNIINTGLDLYPDEDYLLNVRAELYRIIGEYKKGFEDIYKAIEIAPNTGIYFATLAELNLLNGEASDFYLNLNLAFSKGVTEKDIKNAKDVYEKVRTDQKFIDLLERYQLQQSKIFEE